MSRTLRRKLSVVALTLAATWAAPGAAAPLDPVRPDTRAESGFGRNLATWGMSAGIGLAMTLAVVAVVAARRRQARLERAMQEAEQAHAAASAAEAARSERARFDKELTLALQGCESIEDFGRTLLGQLCGRLEAKAAVFHRHDEASGDYLLAARYAGAGDSAVIERYRPGEGIAGQAAVDRRRVVLRGEAAQRMRVESATLVGAAVNIVVAPIVSGNDVAAVVELALMDEVDDRRLEMLDEALPVAALSLDVLRARMRTLHEFSRYRAMEELQRGILSSITNGIFGQDSEGRVSFVNAAALRILGFDEQDLLGQPMHALTHHHYADGREFPRTDCPIFQCTRDGAPRTVRDQVFWRKDGTAVPVEYTVTALMADGKPVGAVVAFSDITERLRNEAEIERRGRQLLDSEARMRTIFETANEGIWLIDTSGRGTDLNPRMAAILGVPREAAIGRTIYDFVDEANAAIFREQIRRRAHGETTAYEIALSRPDGSQVPCLFNATPLLGADGERIGSFAMVADLSGQHRSLASPPDANDPPA